MTPATILLYSVLILVIMLASSMAFRCFGKLYMRERLPMENVILLHRAVIEACTNSYGSVKVEIFVPPGSRIVFGDSGTRYGFVVEGVDIKSTEAEGVRLLLSSFPSDPLSYDVDIFGNTIRLKYKVKSASNGSSRPVSFEEKVIPSGLWSVTLVCKTFDHVGVKISPSG
jgi:hypothetical protein